MSIPESAEEKDRLIMEQHAELLSVRSELEALKKAIYGSTSERYRKVVDNADQLSMFEEQGQVPAPEEKQDISYKRRRPVTNADHPGRNRLPSHLPVEEVTIEPEGGTEGMVKIGEEISEHLEYLPGSLKVIRTVRPKYVHPERHGIHIAGLPSRPIDKGIAGPGLLAFIFVCKYVDHLPYYRQAQRFKREYGWEVAQSTLNEWTIACCGLLAPLYERLAEKVKEGDYMQADESPIKVLDQMKKGGTHQGYQWVYRSPESGLVYFNYRKGRGQNGPKEVLKGYKGILQCDGYKAYDAITDQRKDILQVGCLAHSRRKFVDARSSDRKRSDHALGIFKEIYAHEAVTREKEMDAEDRYRYRKEHIAPLLKGLHAWAVLQAPTAIPKSPMGKAIGYLLNQWPKLERILEDGRIELDNNLIENKIRPLALGRKNYLFAGSHKGAERAAMMYSFFGSCAANGIDPLKWLTDTLKRIKEHPINKIDELLPGHKDL
jgi:transposase